MDVCDQRSDPSRRVLAGIVRRLRDEDLARDVLALGLEDGEKDGASGQAKTACAWPEADLFPCDAPRDLMLSRIYFAGQKANIAEDVAARIEERLGTREILTGTAREVAFKDAEKTAEDRVYELMPGVRAAASELARAGEDFAGGCGRMAYPDRLAFAAGFVKAAEQGRLALPDAVRLYAGRKRPVSAFCLGQRLELRKAAALRRGLSVEPYERLARAMMPMHCAHPDKWAKLREKLETYPDIKFDNEVLGLPSGQGDSPITEDLLRAMCVEELPMLDAPCAQNTGGAAYIAAGIDWGGGEAGLSRTVLSLYAVHPEQPMYLKFTAKFTRAANRRAMWRTSRAG